MKKALMILALMMVCGIAQAQCVATVTDVLKGKKGEILVEIQFYFNGVAEDNKDYKTYFPERLESLTSTEKLNLLKYDAEKTCEQIILHKYSNAKGFPIEELRKEKVDSELLKIHDFLIGKNITKDSVVGEMDSNGDGVNDKQYKITSDGKKTLIDIP